MKLRKNQEVRQLAGVIIVMFIAFAAMAIFATNIMMRSFEHAIVSNLSAVAGVVSELYPDAKNEVVQQLMHMDESSQLAGQELFSQYGLTTDHALLYEINLIQQQHQRLLLYSLGTVVVILLILSFIFYLFLKKRYETVHMLTHYAKNMAEGRESLDIRDNDEGDFSILKNEIFKITSRLKEQAFKLQQDKNRLADSIADISHQLKTPMTSLFVLRDLLEEHPEESVRQEFLRRIRLQLDRMEWLVSSLLTLAKLDAGTLELKQEKMTAKQLIDHALTQLQIPLEIKEHHVELDGDVHVKIICDFAWTSEALINILKNSIEHTPERGRIRLKCEDTPLYARIIIFDQGTGIPREDLPYLFKRFYKGKNARDDSVGIGLAIAYAIMNNQAGDITVTSKQDQGSQFIMTFFRQHL